MGSDSWRTGLRDLAWSAGLVPVVLAAAATAPPGRSDLDRPGYLLLVLASLAVAARRRAPVLVLGFTTACLLAYQLRGYPGVVPAVPMLVALYATVKAGHRFVAGAAVVAVLAGGAAFAAGNRSDPNAFQGWFLIVGWLVAACVMAEVAQHRRAYLDEVERRAADAERIGEETARRLADEERLRIARELHDSLTHSISIIKVQVGVAVHLARKRNEPVPEALLAIQLASTEAMRELRATLEVLRDQHGEHDEQPGSGLDRLPTLLDGARNAGLPVTVRVTGQPRPLPTHVDRAAYRIIQEALTNVTRHAGPATAIVHLNYQAEDLTVRVENDGPGNDDTNIVPGVGLVGMRERVTALGGSLHAAPRDGGGFTVRADLPLHTPA